MVKKEIEIIIRDFADALEKKDAERALSFFIDDATWFNVEGTFKGKEQIKRYITWMFKSSSDMKFKDDGIGIILQGNKAVYQNICEFTYEGKKIIMNIIDIFEFIEGKCITHWTMSDRLSTAKQAVAGPIARMAVSKISTQMQKGLN